MTAILTIAGSDPSGGAGIQADLRVFDHLGLYGLSVITALTAQNTNGVQSFFPIPATQVDSQIMALMEDIRPVATKTGMLPTVEVIESVAETAATGALGTLIIDPVVASTSGTMLSDRECAGRLVSRILPLCHLVTPNHHEAAVLSGIAIKDDNGAMDAARALVDAGAGAACVTGGHRAGPPVDFLFDGSVMHKLEGVRIEAGTDIHGTGCMFSAAVAAYSALGNDIVDAVVNAKRLVEQGIAGAISPGNGMKVPILPQSP